VRGDLLDLQSHFCNEQLKGRIGDPDGTFSIVAPVSVRPIPMTPVGSWVIRIAVRAIVIAAWIIRGPVKDRNRDRYWQTETEEDPGLRLGLSQQRDSKDQRQYDKFFHIVTSTDVKFDFRLRHAAKGIVGTVWAHRRAVRPGQSRWNGGAMQCKVIIAVGVCIPLANSRSLVSPEAFIVDSTFLASCEIGCHPPRDYGEK
jgi:hypothetical protein